MRKKSFIVVLLFCFFSSYAQKELVDSSFQYIEDKYYEYKFLDSLKAKKYANTYLEKALKLKDTIEIIRGKYYGFDLTSNWDPYLEYLNHLVKLTKNNNSNTFPAYIYFKRGDFYLNKGENTKALENYLKLINLKSKKKNIELEALSKQRIGILKGRNGEISLANKYYLEAYNYLKDNNKENNIYNYYSVLINLSTNYIELKKLDSAEYFTHKAYQFSLKIGEDNFTSIAIYKQGVIEFSKQRYSASIDSIKKAIPFLLNEENYRIVFEAYGYLIRSNDILKNRYKSTHYSFLIDSLRTSTRITHFAQRKAYSSLIAHFKEEGNLQNQLKYIEKLLIVDSILNARGKNLNKTFYEEYDKPKLIAEKQRIIQELESNKATSHKTKLILGGIAIFAFFVTSYQYRKRSLLKRRFKELQGNLTSKEEFIDENKKELQKFALPEDLTSDLLERLDEFEKNSNFTDSSITLNSLAKTFETNANYLSKTVNHFKNKGFSAYLSELRINYALELLQVDHTIRKYTIMAIANEVGFKNAESFSKAFYKKTNLRPSYYIKELEKRDARKK